MPRGKGPHPTCSWGVQLQLLRVLPARHLPGQAGAHGVQAMQHHRHVERRRHDLHRVCRGNLHERQQALRTVSQWICQHLRLVGMRSVRSGDLRRCGEHIVQNVRPGQVQCRDQANIRRHVRGLSLWHVQHRPGAQLQRFVHVVPPGKGPHPTCSRGVQLQLLRVLPAQHLPGQAGAHSVQAMQHHRHVERRRHDLHRVQCWRLYGCPQQVLRHLPKWLHQHLRRLAV